MNALCTNLNFLSALGTAAPITAYNDLETTQNGYIDVKLLPIESEAMKLPPHHNCLH